MTQTHTPTRRALLALAALATSALIGACGSSSSSSTSSSTAAASASSGSGTNRAALMACLRKHGITLPSGAGAPGGGAPGGGAPPAGAPSGGSGAPASGSPPSGVPGGANGAKLQAAFKACGANFPARRNGAAVPRQTIQKYVTCVRQHGYQLPNPNFSGNGPVFPASIRSNAKFKTASRACQNLLTPAGASGQAGA